MASKVEQLDKTTVPELQRTLNKQLMVAFINAGLTERAHLDVRSSVVLYDENKEFLYATDVLPDEETLAALYGAAGVRFYSYGV